MKIAVITGEESGDKLAASILRKLKNSTDKSIDLYGIGGKALDEIGIQKFHDISEINVMGIFEVLPKILQISKIINKILENQGKSCKYSIYILCNFVNFVNFEYYGNK